MSALVVFIFRTCSYMWGRPTVFFFRYWKKAWLSKNDAILRLMAFCFPGRQFGILSKPNRQQHRSPAGILQQRNVFRHPSFARFRRFGLPHLRAEQNLLRRGGRCNLRAEIVNGPMLGWAGMAPLATTHRKPNVAPAGRLAFSVRPRPAARRIQP